MASAQAAERELPLAASDRPLTLRGQPLWRVLNTPRGGFIVRNMLAQDDGQISGIAVDDDDQPLVTLKVRARRVTTEENRGRWSGIVVAMTTTDATGRGW